MAHKRRKRQTYGARTSKSEHEIFACKQIIDCASLHLCSDCRASKVHQFWGILVSYGVPRACYVLQLSVGACVTCYSFSCKLCNTVLRVTAF